MKTRRGRSAIRAKTSASQAIEEAEPEAVNLAVVNMSRALAECRGAFPDQIEQVELRTSCVIRTTEFVRPLLPFPELLDRANALRKALAGQVQARTMSVLKRNVTDPEGQL